MATRQWQSFDYLSMYVAGGGARARTQKDEAIERVYPVSHEIPTQVVKCSIESICGLFEVSFDRLSTFLARFG